jgi:hypothetical protein
VIVGCATCWGKFAISYSSGGALRCTSLLLAHRVNSHFGCFWSEANIERLQKADL